MNGVHFSDRCSEVEKVLILHDLSFSDNWKNLCSLLTLESAHLLREQGNESCCTAHTSVCAETMKES
jgi:hypothetical protein